MGAARKKSLQIRRRRRTWNADHDAARPSFLDQRHTPENQRPHHELADFGGPDHQSTKMRRIEGQRTAPTASSAGAGERRPPAELRDLAGELTATICGQGRL